MTAAVPAHVAALTASPRVAARTRPRAPLGCARLHAAPIVTAGLIAVTALAPASARAQAAGQGTSVASVNDNSIAPPYSCYVASGAAATTTATCTPPSAISGSSATANSDNAHRTASSIATVSVGSSGGATQSDATATQVSALTVTGTPSAGDALVFHFYTSTFLVGGVAGSTGSTTAEPYWRLDVNRSGAPVQEDAAAGAYLDAHRAPAVFLQHATELGGDFFDLTLPFVPGSVFSYVFQAQAEAYDATAGEGLTGFVAATLQGIDAETANGAFISSASFDPETGLGSIRAAPTTTTTPEPGTLPLLGTGLVGLAGLVPMARPRRRVVAA